MQFEIYNRLFELIRCALIDARLPDESYPLEQLYALARRHSVAGLVYRGAVNSGRFTESQLLPFKKIYDFQLHRYIVEHADIDGICEGLERQKIRYAPLKGELMRELYPSPELRVSYDVDIFVSSADRSRALPIVESFGYTLTRPGSKDTQLIKDGNRFFELHHALFERSDEQRYYNDLFSLCEPAPGHEYRMCMRPEEVYIYHIKHLAKHFALGNIDMRHVIDCYLFFKRYPTLRRDYIDSQLEAHGSLGFARGVERLSAAWMGEQPFDDFCRRFTEFIIDGVGSECQQRVLLAESASGRGQSGARYLYRRILPHYTTMKGRYPLLAQHPYLLPIFYVVRWVGFIFKDKRYAREELQQVNHVDRSRSESIKRLVDELGAGKLINKNYK